MIRAFLVLVVGGVFMFLFCGGCLAVLQDGLPTPEERAAMNAAAKADAEERAVKASMQAEYDKAEAKAEASRPQMNAANYAKVRMGMTYDEVIAIVGQPSEEISRAEQGGTSAVMYQWNVGLFGSNANMMFQDGKVVTKAQFGL